MSSSATGQGRLTRLADNVYQWGYSLSVRDRLLDELEIAAVTAPPKESLVGVAHPQYVTLQALFGALAEFCPPPVFYPFANGIVESEGGVREIDVRDCYGVAANKSQICPFAMLSNKVNLDDWPNPDKRSNYEHLVQNVFYGITDYAAPADGDMRIKKQAWNSCLWIENGGGGHRSAGLWAYYRRRKIPLPRTSQVTILSIHQSIYRACQVNRYWLFATRQGFHFDYNYYWPNWKSQKDVDAFGVRSVHIPGVGLQNVHCLGWRRDMPFAPADRYLEQRGAIDLSQAIMDGFEDFVLHPD